jgi:cob(I)alamin adenosyltransferase
MIFLFTGDGKGKTTCAIGQAIRALGQGKKVLILQFIKSKKFKSGEEKIISKLGKNIKLIKGGLGFVGILGDKLPLSEHKKAAKETLEMAKKAISERKFDLILLDEINVAISLKLIKIKEVLKLLKKVPKEKDIILTGRDAPKELIEISDLVTEFKEIKHYFKKGILAQKGREF